MFVNKGMVKDITDMSVSDFLDYWIKNYAEINLKYNTIETYQMIINKYIKPILGNYRLCSLTSVTLNSYINDLINRYSFSKAYFKNILKVFKGSFRDACNIYGFIKYNPSLSLRLPKIEDETDKIAHLYTEEEVRKILIRFRHDYSFTCAFLTAFYTGMRTGEVFALTWEDVDLENRIINVRHSIYDKPKDNLGRWYIGSTKTTIGTRKINICDTLFMALNNYKKLQEKLKSYGCFHNFYHLENVTNSFGKVIEKRIISNKTDNEEKINFVFCREDGKFTGTDLIKYPFKIIHDELGINKCRFYDLRGSYATKVLRNGTELRDVADILGHKNIKTTENYYITSTDKDKKEASNKFD